MLVNRNTRKYKGYMANQHFLFMIIFNEELQQCMVLISHIWFRLANFKEFISLNWLAKENCN